MNVPLPLIAVCFAGQWRQNFWRAVPCVFWLISDLISWDCMESAMHLSSLCYGVLHIQTFKRGVKSGSHRLSKHAI